MSAVCKNVVVVEKEDGLHVKSPYYSPFIEWAKKANAKWNPTDKTWVFHSSLKDKVLYSLNSAYGEDGQSDPDYVEVEVIFKKEYSALCGPVELFAKTVARATGRDSGAKPGDQAFFTDGGPKSGGSVKNWQTIIPENSIVRIICVPRNLFERRKVAYEGFAECRIIEKDAVKQAPKPKVELPADPFVFQLGPKSLAKLDEMADAAGVDRGKFIVQIIKDRYELFELAKEE